ncbi:glycosyltransferase [Epilithonimonas hungarica]|uniref:Glycosyltransferase involved in cell wall bisynthesis n=1 Tax=Epilithonimonas hungarica TaxID=454006 RepID=A0A1G7P1G1_9FLAO|nr:glycosyltransferase [Epilithonimonas hungarica]MDP9957342.1 glycosyltransferase involved in cell wall biosynthesis [Epilithonimonas hungarica]SDF80152.1 Glycosyltransferase involved in cell wall bisynthesis [Epilithonimonas hungarica]
MRVLFLTTAHKYNDDRIFYHQATELVKRGFDVKICSLCSEFQGVIDKVEIESYSILHHSARQKTEIFLKVCNDYQPDSIICSEPIAIIAAHKFKKDKKISVIYDVTEWYPAMSMLQDHGFPLKIVHGIKFFLIQLYAGLLSTHFIFGEETKKFPLAYFFPFKKKMILPYYPDESFVSEGIKKLESNQITLCYTGALSEDKGIGNFFTAIEILRKRRPELNIKILIIGSARTETDKIYFDDQLKKLSVKAIEIRKPTSFEDFTKAFSDADICFDLREFNFENHHSLPIKLFYYMGAGKPIIYSSLKGIRKHMDVSDFGFLVDPKDSGSIADCIEKYIVDSRFYDLHATNARKEFIQKYNWKIISDSFINFIENSLPKS